MPERIQWTLAGVLLMIAVTLAAALHLSDRSSTPDSFQVGPSGLAGSLSPPDITPRDFALRDQDGRVLDLAAQRGRVTVLTFLYTTCQDTCPITANQIKSALDELPQDGKDVTALAVSVDPDNDTATLARKFLLARQLTGRMRFLIGTRRQLVPVWKAYGIQPQGTVAQAKADPLAFEHSAYVAVIDKDGRQRVSFPLDQLNPKALAYDIRKLQDE